MCDTVTFIPHTIPYPKVTTDDYLRQAADDIIHILTNSPSRTVPTLEAGDPVRNALLKLAEQINGSKSITTTRDVSSSRVNKNSVETPFDHKNTRSSLPATSSNNEGRLPRLQTDGTG